MKIKALILGSIFTLFVSVYVQSQNKLVPGLNARSGCPALFAKLKKGTPVTIVYFGGSITNHPGYRIYSEKWFKEQYPKSKITAINAGIGGTGSDLGVFRIDDDVIKYNPDLVFVEFAVNDAGTDSLTICRSMEGIVRKLRKSCPQADICFLYTLNQGMLAELMNGHLFKSMRYMEKIADYYGIPSVNFAPDVIRLMKQDSLVFKGEKGVDYGAKRVFTNDGTHPTFDYGHVIYTQTLIRSFMAMKNMKAAKTVTGFKSPLYRDNYELAKAIPLSEFKKSNGWKRVPSNDRIYKYYQASSMIFPDLIVSGNPDDFIEIKFKGRVAGLYDVLGPSSGGFTAEIDGKDKLSIRRFDVYCGNIFRSGYKLLPVMDNGMHTIVIRPDTAYFDKKAVYSSRPSQITDSTYFKPFNSYIGKVLLIGEVLH